MNHEEQADADAEIAEWVGQHYGRMFAAMHPDDKAYWRGMYADAHRPSLGPMEDVQMETVTLRVSKEAAKLYEAIGDEGAAVLLKTYLALDLIFEPTPPSELGSDLPTGLAKFANPMTDDDYIHAAHEMERVGAFMLHESPDTVGTHLAYSYINTAKAYFHADSVNQKMMREDFASLFAKFHKKG